jgi:hypothetical protein
MARLDRGVSSFVADSIFASDVRIPCCTSQSTDPWSKQGRLCRWCRNARICSPGIHCAEGVRSGQATLERARERGTLVRTSCRPRSNDQLLGGERPKTEAYITISIDLVAARCR